MREHQFNPQARIMSESILNQLDFLISQNIEIVLMDVIKAELYIRNLSNKLDAAPLNVDSNNTYGETLISLEKFDRLIATRPQLQKELSDLVNQYASLTREEKIKRLQLTRDGLVKLYEKYKVTPINSRKSPSQNNDL